MSIDSSLSHGMPGDRLSLLTKIARMYHEQGIRQPEIARRLHLSQSRVSRFLTEAVALGIVRTVVLVPPGVHSELEDRVRDEYNLADVVVVDAPDMGDESSLLRALGSAGASYLETTLTGSDRVGISSWSSTLLATVDAMTPRTTRMASSIVQVLGGVGNPRAQIQATHLTDRLARVTGATATFLPAPGVVASAAVRDALLTDPYVKETVDLWSRLTVLLVGIGSLLPSPLLKDSGNAVDVSDQEQLRAAGAVGDVCLHFFTSDGVAVNSALEHRVLGIDEKTMRSVGRTVAIAGGARKHLAIRAAARGGWVDVLVTDRATAEFLVG